VCRAYVCSDYRAGTCGAVDMAVIEQYYAEVDRCLAQWRRTPVRAAHTQVRHEEREPASSEEAVATMASNDVAPATLMTDVKDARPTSSARSDQSVRRRSASFFGFFERRRGRHEYATLGDLRQGGQGESSQIWWWRTQFDTILTQGDIIGSIRRKVAAIFPRPPRLDSALLAREHTTSTPNFRRRTSSPSRRGTDAGNGGLDDTPNGGRLLIPLATLA